MDRKIICFSGRKQAGKDTCYKFLRSLAGPRVERFYFADALKRMCIDILGCPEDKVYGGDDDKNAIVEHLSWENFPVPVWHHLDRGDVYVQSGDYPDFPVVSHDGIVGVDPGVVSWDERDWYYPEGTFLTGNYWRPLISDEEARKSPDVIIRVGRWRRKGGPMTVREVLQYWGTEVFRRQYADVWAKACIRKIEKSDCDIAVITDCRFPNEVRACKDAGGIVVRLSRVVSPGDEHVSETSLDPDRYDWCNFDHVIRNESMNIAEQSCDLYEYLREIWGCTTISPDELDCHYRIAAE